MTRLVLYIVYIMLLCYRITSLKSKISLDITSNNFDRIYNAMKYYKDNNNDNSLNSIPYKYIIPNNTDTISMNINNLKLGNIVSRIRTRGDYRDQHQILQSLGLEVNYINNNNYTKVINALKLYKEKYNDINVKTKYIIPINDTTWPEEYRGMHLGSQIDHLRRKKRQLNMKITNNDTKRHKRYTELNENDINVLNDIGFKWDMRNRLNAVDLLNILVLYKEMHGDINIPVNYVIPSKSPWPKSLYGWKLGQRISHIRNRGDFREYREELDSLGFQWDVWRDRQFKEILEALAEFKKNSLSDSRFKYD